MRWSRLYFITCNVGKDTKPHYFTERNTWSIHAAHRVSLNFQDALREAERLKQINPALIHNVNIHEEHK